MPKFEIARDLSSDNLEQEITNNCDKPSQEDIRLQWDNHKENIQPLAKGRKIADLMRSLQIIDSNKERKELLDKRKKEFDEELKNSADDLNLQLDIWYNYIDWLEQNVPDGGKANNITDAIEQCIEIYYDKKEFKQDKRLFAIFMKFKQFCDEPTEIFGFMYANSICHLISKFYLYWSWQYEMRKNMKRAEDLIRLGLKNLASPREPLLEAREQIKARIERMIISGELNNSVELTPVSSKDSQKQLAEGGIRAALQTLKFKTTKSRGPSGNGASVNGAVNGASIVPINRSGSAIDTVNVGGLKSQTKLVNGVSVAKNKRPLTKTSTTDKKSNKPVQIYSDQENGRPAVVPKGGVGLKALGENDVVGDENGPVSGRVASSFIKQIPTSQRIQSVGRIGLENQIQSSGVVRNGASSSGNNTNVFKVPFARR